jgi:hypothetical protein
MESAGSIERGGGDVTYKIAPGSQVRGERGGLLFYRRKGPRLYYLPCGSRMSPEFFSSGKTLREWLNGKEVPSGTIEALENALAGLEAKGVVHACRRCP